MFLPNSNAFIIFLLLNYFMTFSNTTVKQQWYFASDLASVFCSFLIHRRWGFMILLQNIQHIFYIVTWDQR